MPGTTSDTFDGIRGHGEVLTRLSRLTARDRLPHAMLFAGSDGVGKRTVALALAAAYLGADPSHLRAGTHPDVHVVTRHLVRLHDRTGKSKAIHLSADVVREELVRPASHHSVTGRGKFFLVEEAHTMTIGAQNAMLKTLEEPPGRTVIVLLSSRPGLLLPTIRSRVQTFTFGMPPAADALHVVVSGGVPADEAREALEVAGGSPGLALAFLRDGVVSRAGELPGVLAAPGGMGTWFKEAADAFADARLKLDPLGSKDALTREGLTLYLTLAGEVLRRRLPDATPADAAGTCDAIEAVVRAEKYLAANANVALVFQQLELALTP